jgi:hypothetical protein
MPQRRSKLGSGEKRNEHSVPMNRPRSGAKHGWSVTPRGKSGFTNECDGRKTSATASLAGWPQFAA